MADATTVRRALDVLAGVGYRPDHTWRRGAARSFWRTAGEVRATRSDDVTHVVRLRWRPPARGIRRRLDRLVRPSPPDWDAVELPAWAWWGYRAVRPVRLALERARRHPRDHAHLEPFLTTPRSLAPGLLAFAGVGPDDVLVDLGCGDGRLVIAAAATTGCRAIGVELDADLAATARAGVAGTALDDRVSVVAGDAADLPLDDVTVVTMFLPTAVLRRAVPDTLARLPAGARLLAHEQAGLPPGLAAPAATAVIVGDDGVTVAHRWDVPVTQPGGDGATPSTVTAR